MVRDGCAEIPNLSLLLLSGTNGSVETPATAPENADFP